MAVTELADRLAGLDGLADIPRSELEWVAAHAECRVWEAGATTFRKGDPIDHLWIPLTGRTAILIDRGVGARRYLEWRPGDVSGVLPYSRMSVVPGESRTIERSEVVMVHRSHFPAMTRECPVLTAHTVHVMIDRARAFRTSDLQDEKMVSLGKLAAGLAHELNNPASATVRAAKLLHASMEEADEAARSVGAAEFSAETLETMTLIRAACMAQPIVPDRTPIEQSMREDEITDWLDAHGADPECATQLADTAISIETLDALATRASRQTLMLAIRWIAAGSAMSALAADIERAATRIHELVAAIKRFTYMDQRAGSQSASIAAGLVDTVKVLAAKAKSKAAAVTLDIPPDLPRVRMAGGELNQVWMNLIDNALDAIPEAGAIHISAHVEADQVVVSVVDDGPGIPAEITPKIFDPFFTTKPPGQGTGLGLDIAQKLVRGYGGDILVDSRPGRTEFRVSLAAE